MARRCTPNLGLASVHGLKWLRHVALTATGPGGRPHRPDDRTAATVCLEREYDLLIVGVANEIQAPVAAVD